jgi:hypothetical protein
MLTDDDQDIIPPASVPATPVDNEPPTSLAIDGRTQAADAAFIEEEKTSSSDGVNSRFKAATTDRNKTTLTTLDNDNNDGKLSRSTSQMVDVDLEAGELDDSQRPRNMRNDKDLAIIGDNSSNHNNNSNSNSNRDMDTAAFDAENTINPPELVNPLSLLIYLLEWELAPTYWFAGTTFAA